MKFILSLILLAGLSAHAYAQSDRFYLAHYNLENLFDTIDDPQTDDADFTIGSKLKWTAERLNLKNEKLAQVIGDMNTGMGPDVLGLCEVENRQVLEQLLGQLRLSKRRYSIVHEESPDPRGIDVALLYDTKKLKLLSHRAMAVTHAGQADWRTRDILCISLLTSKKQHIHILVNHWPSRRGGQAQTDPLRGSAARVARRLVDSLHNSDPQGLVVVMGDFNDRPGDVAPAQILQSGPECKGDGLSGLELAMNPSVLFNPFASLDMGQTGSYRYKDEWQFIDHISISHRACSPDSKLRYVEGSAASVVFPYMLETEGKYAGNPIRTYGGEKYLGGYSDHLPVKIQLKLIK
jgi:predicted extracellular nuclease